MRKTNRFVFFLAGFVVLLSLIGTNPAFAWTGNVVATVGAAPNDTPGGAVTIGVEACTNCTDANQPPGQIVWLYDSPPTATRYISYINSDTTKTSYMWVMRIVVAIDPVTIDWDFSTLPAGTFVMKSGQDGNGTVVVADMRTTKTYTDASGGYFTIHYTPSATTTRTVTFVAGTGGTLTGTTPQTVADGGNCTAVEAVPNSGFEFVNWTGTGGFATTTTNPLTVTNVTADMTITANFQAIPTNRTVTFVAGTGGTLTGTTPQTVANGGSCTAVEAVPNSGFTFVNWTGTGGFATTTTNPLTVTNVTADMTITANFACTPPTITANPSAATDGTGIEAGTSVTFTGSASGNWAFGDGGTENNTANPAAHTYVNAGSYTVTLTVGGCSATAKVTVVPKDCSSKVNSNFTATANGLDVTVAVTDTPAGNYNVTFGDSTAAVTTLPNTHTYAAPGTYTITVTSSEAAPGTCTSTSSQQITVGCAAANKPNITAPAAPITGTAGTAITFTSDVAVNWNFGDGGTASNTTTPPDHTYVNAGNYTVTITTASGCSNTAAVAITSSCAPGDMAKISTSTDPPEAGKPYAIGNGTTVPSGTFTSSSQVVWQITNLATGEVSGPTTPGTADPFSMSHTFPSAGDYLVSLTTTVGTCTSTATQMVTVIPAKNKSVILANGAITVPLVKPGEAVTFTNQNGSFFNFSSWTITAPNSADNFDIDSSDPITYTFPTAGTYTVAVSGVGGTGDSSTVTMTIVVSSQAITSVTPNTGDAGTTSVVIATSGFTNTFTVGGVTVTFGGTNATVTAVDDTAKTVTVTVPAGSGTVDVTVTVGSQTATKTGAFTYNVTGPVITGLSPSSGLTGTTAYNITVNGNNFEAGNATAVYCTTTTAIAAGTTLANVSTAYTDCTVLSGTTATATAITGVSLPASATAKTYRVFVFNPGSGLWSSSAAFTISSTVPSITNAVSTTTGTVYAGVATQLKITGQGTNFAASSKVYYTSSTGAACGTTLPATKTLIGTPVASPAPTTTSITTPSVTFPSVGNYCIFVCDAADANCVSYNLYANQQGSSGDTPVVPSFGIDSITGNGSANQITGVAEFTVKFASTATGSVWSYLWDFGDGETSTEATPTHVYKTPGLYTVKLTISGFLGIGSATKEVKDFVKVVTPPAANFACSPTSGKVPLTVTCTADTYPGATQYAWNFGDNQTGEGQSVSHTFGAAGTFTITMTVTYDDAALTRALKTATATATIVVTPALTCDTVTAAFTANPMTGTRPLTVNFDASASANADGYSWNFGDNQTGTGKNVSHTFAAAGTYTVMLKTTNSALAGCEKSVTQDITVSEKPCEVTAVFTASKLTGDVPLIVNFDATASAKATSFAWTFGDGETGSGVTATHTYTKAGTYTVTLTAKDDVCTKTATQTIQVNASDRPAKPILLSPENGVTTRVPLTPTLKTQSTYSSPVNSPHAKTRWQIATDADFKNVVYDVTNATNLTSIWVPDFMLMEDTKYWWRAQFIDNRGYASDWADPFTMLTVQINPEDVNGNGVPETQEITDANSDIDANGVADTKQTDAIFAKMGTKGASGIKVIAANFAGWLKYINMSTLPTPPAGYEFPWGAMTFRVETKNIGDSAVITVYFSEALPSGAKWFNYNQIEGWKDYSQYATFSANRKVVTLTLKDGGVGDADGVANGAIVDPAAIGIPTTTPAPAVCLDCDSSSGCFISAVSGAGMNAASAAMLTLVTMAGIFFARRRK